MNTNTLRRLNWLWKHRHTHDDDNLAEQLTIIVGEVQQQVDSATATGEGAYIHLARAATQEIAAGGEAIVFDQLGLLGFAGFAPPPGIGDDGTSGGALSPSDEIVIPITGYWDVKLAAGWDSFTGGGSVWITRTRSGVESTIYPPAGMPAGLWTASAGQIGEWIAKALPLTAGDILKLYIDADESTAQDLAAAVVSVELIDRARNRSYYRELVLSHGPVAYWRLDETSGTTATDETGNGHNGTYTDTGETQNADPVMVDGSGSPSVQFDGSAGHVNVAEFLGNGWSAITLETWVYEDTTTRIAVIAGRDKFSSDNPNPYAIVGFGNGAWDFRIHAGGTYHNLNTPASTGRHHLALTYDGATFSAYVDGQLVGSESASGAIQTDETLPFRIGNYSDGGGVYPGRIDEVALYDRALTAAEILEHYQVGTGGL